MNIALVPYWLNFEPRLLKDSDNYWWFEPIQKYELVIYAGPGVSSALWNCPDTNLLRCTFKTTALSWDLSELASINCIINSFEISDISLIWNVIEATPTCRVSGLNMLDCNKYAAIGDTHHLHAPISSLLDYLVISKFTALFCTQSQHRFFFSNLTGIATYSFPYSIPVRPPLPPTASPIFESSLTYAGSLNSLFHRHRTRVVNTALLHYDICLLPRASWLQWQTRLSLTNKKYLVCSLNSNFSPQLLFPLLYSNVVFSDQICVANWLGQTIADHNICFVYDSPEHLIGLLEAYGPFSCTPVNNLAESQMACRAANLLMGLLNSLDDVQSAMLQCYPDSPALKTFETSFELKLYSAFREIQEILGISYAFKLLVSYEYIQMLTTRHWRVALVCDTTVLSSSHPSIAFWSLISLLLPRVSFELESITSMVIPESKYFCLSLSADGLLNC